MPVGSPATESGVEIRILERLFTPDDAALALELNAISEPARVIHKRLAGMPSGHLARALDRTPELVRDSEQHMQEAFGKAFHRTGTVQMRIVLVNRKIAVECATTTYDDIRAYVQVWTGPFARMKCICRHGIECALCVGTCPSGAMRLVAKPAGNPPPDDTRGLYLRLFRERYGTLGMAQLGARRLLGMKF